MSIQKIQSITFYFSGACVDAEQKEIAARLLAYGITPTGNKTTDKAKLREIELQKAKQENCVSNKFLTVSSEEQQKIQDKKKEKREENNQEITQDNFIGAKVLGEQIYNFLKYKKKKDK